MQRGRKGGGGLVAYLLLMKQLIGIGAVLGVFYLTVPWGLISVASRGEGLSPAGFTAAINAWATGLADNILLVVLLMFIAILTYGPEVLDLVAGPNGGN